MYHTLRSSISLIRGRLFEPAIPFHFSSYQKQSETRTKVSEIYFCPEEKGYSDSKLYFEALIASDLRESVLKRYLVVSRFLCRYLEDVFDREHPDYRNIGGFAVGIPVSAHISNATTSFVHPAQCRHPTRFERSFRCFHERSS